MALPGFYCPEGSDHTTGVACPMGFTCIGTKNACPNQAMSGTDQAYAARGGQRAGSVRCRAGTERVMRSAYAMSGTDIVYGVEPALS
eukprot:928507-Rhodomonas_salina.1